MLANLSRRSRVLILTGLVMLLAAAGWSLAWLRIADRMRGEVEGWVAGRRADGLKVDYTTIAVTGYPLHWRVTVGYPNMAGAGPTEWTWQGYAVEADLSPWSTHEIPLRFPGDQRFSASPAPTRHSNATARAAFCATSSISCREHSSFSTRLRSVMLRATPWYPRNSPFSSKIGVPLVLT